MPASSSGKQSSAIRVLVANVSGDVKALLAGTVKQYQDIDFIDSVQGYVEILVAARNGVDVIVLCEPQVQPLPGICSHLLSEYPDVKILILSPSGDEAMLYWLGLQQERQQIASPEILIGALRYLHARPVIT